MYYINIYPSWESNPRPLDGLFVFVCEREREESEYFLADQQEIFCARNEQEIFCSRNDHHGSLFCYGRENK